jgi:MoaA/NifB/PqqE/SkfB family radical SAM enzyme
MAKSRSVEVGLLESGFCVYPFTTLEIDAVGKLRPCCLHDEPYLREDGAPFDTRHDRLVDVWRSGAAEALRQDFLAGRRPPACERCWEVEAVGGRSRRTTQLADRPEHLADALAARPKLRVLQLNPGNRCNLRCRTCHPSSSSAWRNEWREVSLQARARGTRAQGRDATPDHGDTDWAAEPSRVWNDIEPLIADLEILEIHGGEPMLIFEHLELLERCIAAGRAGHVTLSYNTNGTRIPEKALALWPRFRRVMIQVSLDGVGPRFEYLRYPAKWNEVAANILKLQALPYVDLSCNATVSALNVLYLGEFLTWAAQAKLRAELLPFGKPAWYDPRTLPKEAKAEARRRLVEATLPDGPSERSARLLDLMDSEDWADAWLPELSLRTRLHDEYRRQRVEDFLPALVPYLPPVP